MKPNETAREYTGATKALRPSRYGWHLLTHEGAAVQVTLAPDDVRRARVSAQGYARRNGFRVSLDTTPSPPGIVYLLARRLGDV